MAQEEQFDIYGDLNDFDASVKLKEVTAELEALKEKQKEIVKQMEALEAVNRHTKIVNATMKKNFYALLNTAKAEVTRKDGNIAKLRQEKDNVLFRRDRKLGKVSKSTQTDGRWEDRMKENREHRKYSHDRFRDRLHNDETPIGRKRYNDRYEREFDSYAKRRRSRSRSLSRGRKFHKEENLRQERKSREMSVNREVSRVQEEKTSKLEKAQKIERKSRQERNSREKTEKKEVQETIVAKDKPSKSDCQKIEEKLRKERKSRENSEKKEVPEAIAKEDKPSEAEVQGIEIKLPTAERKEEKADEESLKHKAEEAGSQEISQEIIDKSCQEIKSTEKSLEETIPRVQEQSSKSEKISEASTSEEVQEIEKKSLQEGESFEKNKCNENQEVQEQITVAENPKSPVNAKDLPPSKIEVKEVQQIPEEAIKVEEQKNQQGQIENTPKKNERIYQEAREETVTAVQNILQLNGEVPPVPFMPPLPPENTPEKPPPLPPIPPEPPSDETVPKSLKDTGNPEPSATQSPNLNLGKTNYSIETDNQGVVTVFIKRKKRKLK